MHDTEIDLMASTLARQLTVFQLAAERRVPTVVLTQLVEIVNRCARSLLLRLREQPDVEVMIDPRMPEPMESAYLAIFGASTDVPDTIPEEWDE